MSQQTNKSILPMSCPPTPPQTPPSQKHAGPSHGRSKSGSWWPSMSASDFFDAAVTEEPEVVDEKSNGPVIPSIFLTPPSSPYTQPLLIPQTPTPTGKRGSCRPAMFRRLSSPFLPNNSFQCRTSSPLSNPPICPPPRRRTTSPDIYASFPNSDKSPSLPTMFSNGVPEPRRRSESLRVVLLVLLPVMMICTHISLSNSSTFTPSAIQDWMRKGDALVFGAWTHPYEAMVAAAEWDADDMDTQPPTLVSRLSEQMKKANEVVRFGWGTHGDAEQEAKERLWDRLGLDEVDISAFPERVVASSRRKNGGLRKRLQYGPGLEILE